ncbi:hypothetical protein HDU96_005809 [Phlyctochytrium bullatum]|nr:hypothetical protein HDU96_005809 [Phlyctochytrium bullatum]
MAESRRKPGGPPVFAAHLPVPELADTSSRSYFRWRVSANRTAVRPLPPSRFSTATTRVTSEDLTDESDTDDPHEDASSSSSSSSGDSTGTSSQPRIHHASAAGAFGARRTDPRAATTDAVSTEESYSVPDDEEDDGRYTQRRLPRGNDLSLWSGSVAKKEDGGPTAVRAESTEGRGEGDTGVRGRPRELERGTEEAVAVADAWDDGLEVSGNVLVWRAVWIEVDGDDALAASESADLGMNSKVDDGDGLGVSETWDFAVATGMANASDDKRSGPRMGSQDADADPGKLEKEGGACQWGALPRGIVG